MASTADHERLVALAAHDASHDARLLCSDGTSFTTHSCFLGLASPVLQQNLWGPWMRPAEDGYRAISLPQPQAVVRLFVEHAYHGNAAPLPPEHATALLDLAKVYDVPPLTRRCERVLVEHMCVPNAVDALLWADAFLLDDLRTAARKVLLSKFEEVMHEPAFGRLPEADLLTLLSDDGLCIDREETAFEAISIWTSAHESGDFSAPPVDLTALLCTLRFAAMPPGYLREISTHAILQRASMGSAIGDALRELTEELEAADKANDALSVPQPKRQRISPRRHASSASSSSSSPAVTAAAADVGVSATTTAVDDVELSWACAECTFKHSPEQASFAVCRMCGTQRLKASTVTRDEAELACVLSEQSDLYRQMGAHASGPPRTPTPMVAFPPKYALALGGQFATPVGPRPAVRLARAAAAGRVFKFEPEEMEAPGLLAWLGTKGGTLAWANPHTLEQVRISAFFHRFGFHDGEGLVECTDAHAMVDRFGLDVYTVPEASERLSALRQQYTVRRNQERLGSEPEIVRSCFMSNSDEMLLDLKRPFILTSFSASTYSPGISTTTQHPFLLDASNDQTQWRRLGRFTAPDSEDSSRTNLCGKTRPTPFVLDAPNDDAYRYFRFRSVAALRPRSDYRGLAGLLADDGDIPSRARYLPFLRVEFYGAIPVQHPPDMPHLTKLDDDAAIDLAAAVGTVVGQKRRAGV